jgi:hypothetical protein
MSLNLNASSPSVYINAVNDSRFVRTFGVIALLGSIFIFIGGGVAIGIGLAVMGFGSGRYYRTLGIAVVILAILGFFLEPFRIIASLSLAVGVAWKGKTVLNTLALEGKEDADWQVTRKRAITGIVLCIVGVVISLAWLGLSLVGLVVR